MIDQCSFASTCSGSGRPCNVSPACYHAFTHSCTYLGSLRARLLASSHDLEQSTRFRRQSIALQRRQRLLRGLHPRASDCQPCYYVYVGEHKSCHKVTRTFCFASETLEMLLALIAQASASVDNLTSHERLPQWSDPPMQQCTQSEPPVSWASWPTVAALCLIIVALVSRDYWQHFSSSLSKSTLSSGAAAVAARIAKPAAQHSISRQAYEATR
jgi:hypothetical protein